MAKYQTAQGSEMSFGGGKCKLIVSYYNTKTSIVFKPYIKVTDAFKEQQTIAIQWQDGSEKFGTKHNVKVKSKTNSVYIKSDSSKTWTNGDYQVVIKATCGSKKSQVTLTNNYMVPAKPDMTVTRTGDYRYDIFIKQSENKKDIPTKSIVLERKANEDSGSWEELHTWTMNETGMWDVTYHDQTTARGNRYQYRVRASNNNGNSDYNADKDWHYTLPPDVSDVQHIRSSNYQNIVSWSKSGQEIDRKLIVLYRIYRSVSGGSYVLVGEQKPGAAADGTVTFYDKTTEPNEYYKYIVKPCSNVEGVITESKISYPSDEGTEPTYNTPAAPLSIKATHTMAGKQRNILEINNPEKTATELQIQKYQNDEWVDLDPVDETDGPVTHYEDTSTNPQTVTLYRARNYRDDDTLSATERASAWKESNELQALSKPNAPTLISPANNSLVLWGDGTAKLQWIHNPTDGTEQFRAFYVVYKWVDSNWIDVESSYITGSQQYIIFNFSNYGDAGTKFRWRVKTMGEYVDPNDHSGNNSGSAGPFSAGFNFTVVKEPMMTINEPHNGASISNLPLTLTFTYRERGGDITKAVLNILHNNEIVYTENLDLSVGEPAGDHKTRFTYSLANYLFENNERYILQVTATDEYGLQVTQNVNINILYVPIILQDQYLLDFDNDSETGYVTLFVSRAEDVAGQDDPDPDAPQPVIVNSPVEHAYLYRIYNGNKTFLGEVSENTTLIDKYAPLNADYTYQILEIAENGNVSVVEQVNHIYTNYWFSYYGQNNDKIARAKWNPAGDASFGRPDRQQVRYSGRTYPVSYDSEAREETFSFSAVITDRETLELYKDLMKDGAQGVWKSADGDVYRADFDFSYNATYSDIELTWSAKLEVTRIESEAL